MTSRKLIQNFRANRGLLFASADFQAQTLERTLARLGVALVAGEDADLSALDDSRDIVFVDGDLAAIPAGLVADAPTVACVPVIGLVGAEAPSRLRMLSEAGATSILRKPVAASAVYSALFFGVNLHRQLRATEARLAAGEKRHHDRRYVVKAVVSLMGRRGLGDDDAYAELRRESMRRRMTVEDYARALFENGDFKFPHQEKESADARFADAGYHPDGTVDGGSGDGGRPDQARRA